MKDLCHKCWQPIQDGELVTGLTWSGDGGAHIKCPLTPADRPSARPPHSGFYEIGEEV